MSVSGISSHLLAVSLTGTGTQLLAGQLTHGTRKAVFTSAALTRAFGFGSGPDFGHISLGYPYCPGYAHDAQGVEVEPHGAPSWYETSNGTPVKYDKTMSKYSELPARKYLLNTGSRLALATESRVGTWMRWHFRPDLEADGPSAPILDLRFPFRFTLGFTSAPASPALFRHPPFGIW
ncbi:hypothetical protein B0H13DRAFT_1881979 [Mycena leptocephala]|nr:hypothetical protein B0H13DRAFT_1881979 [Mycena leptocephala]